MSRRLMTVLVLSPAIALPLLAQGEIAEKGAKQTFAVSSTDHVNFAPGGTIQINNSYGHLSVEGWDSPEVQITVIKSTNDFYKPQEKDEISRRFEQIRVVTERRSDKELSVSTFLATRHSRLSPPLPRTTKEGVMLEYRVLVPRDSRLVVHHDFGYVWVSDVTGALDVRSHTGDMIVLLSDPGPYTIDARSQLGRISSDFVGKSRFYPLFWHAGFASGHEPQASRVYLRMGRGNITIKKGPPYTPFGKD
jgi:hypothetical protein